ncbi:MAG: hypothetical protein JSV09_13070 [Thermoplasmata archaeon]|nr:MAG: hypothetical protein JSV09_13070 [Thermoplasmata archaeon]
MNQLKRIFCVILCAMMLTTVFTFAVTTNTSSSQAIGQIEVRTNKKMYKNNEPIAISVRNVGNTTVEFGSLWKIELYDNQGNQIYPSPEMKRAIPGGGSWELPPGEQEIYHIDPAHLLFPEWPGDDIEIKVVDTVDPADIIWDGPLIPIRGKGVVILVCGNFMDDLQTIIDEACNKIYDDLKCIGYGDDDIYYLNNWANWRVDDIASSDNLEDAITIWADAITNPWTPLFLVMFDHGGTNSFSLNNPLAPADSVSAAELDGWLDTLELSTGADIHTWIMACHSGSFIDELSSAGRVTITSSKAAESSYPSAAPYWEYFTEVYWPKIKWGWSLGDAFNAGSWRVAEDLNWYHPLLDDNGDGVGHGWDEPAGSGDLPHDGDGNLAFSVTMGDRICLLIARIPLPLLLIPAEPYPWPPQPLIPLWVEIASPEPISHVKASMIPPDWVPPKPDNTLTEVPLEYFEMEDPDGDGIWRVDIPESAFTAHATGPTNFQFVITAEDEGGRTMVPCTTSVRFHETGTPPPPDTEQPSVLMRSPLRGQIAQGPISVNGIASDDVCLQKVEIFADRQLLSSYDLPPSSNSFFDLNLDTTTLPDGATDIWMRITDKSGNTFVETIPVMIVNNPVQFGSMEVDIHPETLNLGSKGRWVSCIMDQPKRPDGGEDKDPIWLVLNGGIPAEHLIHTGHSLNVKFDRSDLEDMLSPGDDIVLTVSGEFEGVGLVMGEDTIRAIDP